MSRPSPLSFARKKALQRKRIVAPLRCRGLIDAFEKSFAKPLWKKFHWGFSFARKKALQRKRIVAPLRCRGLIDAFLEKSLAKKLNRVTPSTTCVRNMLSTYIVNRASVLKSELQTPVLIFLFCSLFNSIFTSKTAAVSTVTQIR